MNLAAVARELDARMATLVTDGTLAAHYLGQGRKSVSTPCSVVPMPDIDYLQTYARGMDRIPNWEIALLAGKVDDENAIDRMGIYADGSGPASIKEILESTSEDFDPYTACQTVIVKSCTFDVITWQGQDFQGALFTIDVIGSGA